MTCLLSHGAKVRRHIISVTSLVSTVTSTLLHRYRFCHIFSVNHHIKIVECHMVSVYCHIVHVTCLSSHGVTNRATIESNCTIANIFDNNVEKIRYNICYQHCYKIYSETLKIYFSKIYQHYYKVHDVANKYMQTSDNDGSKTNYLACSQAVV